MYLERVQLNVKSTQIRYAYFALLLVILLLRSQSTQVPRHEDLILPQIGHYRRFSSLERLLPVELGLREPWGLTLDRQRFWRRSELRVAGNGRLFPACWPGNGACGIWERLFLTR